MRILRYLWENKLIATLIALILALIWLDLWLATHGIGSSETLGGQND